MALAITGLGKVEAHEGVRQIGNRLSGYGYSIYVHFDPEKDARYIGIYTGGQMVLRIWDQTCVDAFLRDPHYFLEGQGNGS